MTINLKIKLLGVFTTIALFALGSRYADSAGGMAVKSARGTRRVT